MRPFDVERPFPRLRVKHDLGSLGYREQRNHRSFPSTPLPAGKSEAVPNLYCVNFERSLSLLFVTNCNKKTRRKT